MRRPIGTFVAGLLLLSLLLSISGREARADGLLAHDAVDGANIDVMDLGSPGGKTESVAFTELGKLRTPATYTLRLALTGEDVRIPHCNGRGAVTVDGTVRDKGSKGPLVLHLGGEAVHDVRIEVAVSTYEKRIACGERVRVGTAARASEGLTLFRFKSPHAGPAAGEAVVFVPRGHDPKKPGALLVGVHPWNGSPWTYAAYRELLEEAQSKDVVLLMPSGLGNSLYTAEPEDEVMRAIDAVTAEIAIDPQRVSIWGASMGGQGATTIGFHRPHRFAFVASYFGDAKLDVSSYVRSILPTEDAAHKFNPLDVIDNARHVPLWLIHGEDDKTSPIVQSTMLFDAMQKRHFKVDFDRVPGMGHEGPLVVKLVKRVVDRAAEAHAPLHPARVSFRSTRGIDSEAYGVRIVRAGERDAFVDLEKRYDGIHVLAGTEGVTQIVLRPGALGAREGDPIILDPGVSANVRWGP
jgi:pimeloyl-ACP methyl ester carboxylesterase